MAERAVNAGISGPKNFINQPILVADSIKLIIYSYIPSGRIFKIFENLFSPNISEKPYLKIYRILNNII